MKALHARLLAPAAVLLLLTACTADVDEDPASDDSSAASPDADSGAETGGQPAVVPSGEGEGSVELVVAGEELPGEDWRISCGELDGDLTVIATALPLTAVQLTTSPDGEISMLDVSAEGVGPYFSDLLGVGTLAADVTETGFTLSGEFEQGGEVDGTLTCPA